MSQEPAPDFFTPPQERRNFVKELAAVIIGVLVGIVPAAVGLLTFFNPLRKSVQARQRPSGSDAEGYFRVAPLETLGETPQAFKIIADRRDAWNVFRQEAIGAVYLSRLGTKDVRAFNVSCPHAGCAVDWRPAKHAYHCPCHNSSFAEDGTRAPKSPSARDLDSLSVKIADDGMVWVKFQNFKAGDKEKKPV